MAKGKSESNGMFELPGGLVHFVSDEAGFLGERPSPFSEGSPKDQKAGISPSREQLFSLSDESKKGKK